MNPAPAPRRSVGIGRATTDGRLGTPATPSPSGRWLRHIWRRARAMRPKVAMRSARPRPRLSNPSRSASGGTRLITHAPAKAAGTEPTHSHRTSDRFTVPRRRWTKAPTGFMNSETMMSLEIAVSGSTPKKNTSIGVMSAPPPIPVRPTMVPTRSPPMTRGKSTVTREGLPLAAPKGSVACADDTFGPVARGRFSRPAQRRRGSRDAGRRALVTGERAGSVGIPETAPADDTTLAAALARAPATSSRPSATEPATTAWPSTARRSARPATPPRRRGSPPPWPRPAPATPCCPRKPSAMTLASSRSGSGSSTRSTAPASSRSATRRRSAGGLGRPRGAVDAGDGLVAGRRRPARPRPGARQRDGRPRRPGRCRAPSSPASGPCGSPSAAPARRRS